MTDEPVNKSMDRDDLLTPEGQRFVSELNSLHGELERRQLPVTSWYGGLLHSRFGMFAEGLRTLAWPDDPEQKYSFGAMFLRKRADR
jgi:hypothetical protein